MGKKHYLCMGNQHIEAMKPAILLLTILVAGGALVWLIDRLFYRRPEDENTPAGDGQDTGQQHSQGCTDESCSLRGICPSEQLLAGECRQEIIYYDDEELDRYRGRDENGYTDEELEQWRDVLYTLRAEDLLGWGQSVKRRGLVMPTAIRTEFLHLAGEHRADLRQ